MLRIRTYLFNHIPGTCASAWIFPALALPNASTAGPGVAGGSDVALTDRREQATKISVVDRGEEVGDYRDSKATLEKVSRRRSSMAILRSYRSVVRS